MAALIVGERRCDEPLSGKIVDPYLRVAVAIEPKLDAVLERLTRVRRVRRASADKKPASARSEQSSLPRRFNLLDQLDRVLAYVDQALQVFARYVQSRRFIRKLRDTKRALNFK